MLFLLAYRQLSKLTLIVEKGLRSPERTRLTFSELLSRYTSGLVPASALGAFRGDVDCSKSSVYFESSQ